MLWEYGTLRKSWSLWIRDAHTRHWPLQDFTSKVLTMMRTGEAEL